jgi:transcriptional regulator with XRE-family HTH domain
MKSYARKRAPKLHLTGMNSDLGPGDAMPSALVSRPITETARRVRAARAYAGLSVQELADGIGLGLQTIKRIEAGKRSARRYEIWAIAEACSLPRDFFEIDFGLLCERAETMDALLRRVDDRLAKIERLGGPSLDDLAIAGNGG